MDLTCSVLDCGRGGKIKRGLCTMHYTRLMRTGRTDLVEYIVWEPQAPAEPQAVEFGSPVMPARVWERSQVVEHSCWYWTGDKDKGGYGRTSVGRRTVAKTRLLHRLSYLSFVGEVPEGLFLDHYRYPDACIGQSCFRPDHVRPVTNRENNLRADSIVAWNRAKTHCPQGHPYAGDNLIVKNGGRQCRTCRRAYMRSYHERIKKARGRRAA